jgi:hypothetical protein
MRKTTIFLTSFIALLVFAVGCLMSQLNLGPAAAIASASSGNLQPALSSPSGKDPAAMGIPAIRSRTGTASLVLADVQQFVNTHPFFGGPTVSGGRPIVVKLLAIPSKEVVALTHGESTGLPESAPVYYVQLQGPFLLVNAGSPRGAKVLTLGTGVEVFDARTGNLILWGAF